jgi:ATP-dependent Lhr-like helicase
MSDRDLIALVGPVGQAFFGRFDHLRDVQRATIQPVLQGHDVLVSSATASGKTEAIMVPLVARIQQSTVAGIIGTRILVISPTRALVNDLHSRLVQPLETIGWSCGRQTSDHRDKYKHPSVLITTPESLDSMLVRDGQWVNSRLSDHLLAQVCAVFLDEVHLYAASARGDQVSMLLVRLRRLAAAMVTRERRVDNGLQVVAASATVERPEVLGRRFLGSDWLHVAVAGSREMAMLASPPSGEWIPFSPDEGIASILSRLAILDEDHLEDGIADAIWRSIAAGRESGCRKVLVFVPSRRLCDSLGRILKEKLRAKRSIFVTSHHGSLDRQRREAAEHDFASHRDAVLVATTTLEIGVDIGDVDAVCLVGPPPSTNSLLQRIGRSGRREGIAKVVTIVRNTIEARAMASMLEAGFRGIMDESAREMPLWSVYAQQCLSYAAQLRLPGMTREHLLTFAKNALDGENSEVLADSVIDSLIKHNLLTESFGRLRLGDAGVERLDEGGGALHHNIGDTGKGTPVVNAMTGEIVAHVGQSPASSGIIDLAGQKWSYILAGDEILLRSSSSAGPAATFQYATRAAPMERIFAAHVQRGLGLDARSAPLRRVDESFLWYHFGGTAYERLLRSFHPGLKEASGLRGLALVSSAALLDMDWSFVDDKAVEEAAQDNLESMASLLSLGPFYEFLPNAAQRHDVLSIVRPDAFCGWLKDRRVWVEDSGSAMNARLASLT